MEGYIFHPFFLSPVLLNYIIEEYSIDVSHGGVFKSYIFSLSNNLKTCVCPFVLWQPSGLS